MGSELGSYQEFPNHILVMYLLSIIIFDLLHVFSTNIDFDDLHSLTLLTISGFNPPTLTLQLSSARQEHMSMLNAQREQTLQAEAIPSQQVFRIPFLLQVSHWKNFRVCIPEIGVSKHVLKHVKAKDEHVNFGVCYPALVYPFMLF